MLKRNSAIALTTLIVLLMVLAAFTAAMAKAEETTPQTPRIWTDKEDYSPEETVTIYGEGFAPNAAITVNVTRPDGHVDSSLDEGDNVVYKVTIVYREDGTTDAEGKFNATYKLDGILGEYTVTATDGTNIATTTFTDADIGSVSVSPNTQTIAAGGTATYTVTVAKTGGSTLSVDLSIVGSLPTGSSITFTPNQVTFLSSESGTKTSTLTIETSPYGSTGTFNFVVRGTKTGTGNTADSNTVSLIVQPSFSVTFGATAIGADVADATEVLTVTIGVGSPISVTKAELPKTFNGIASGTTITYSYNSPLDSTNTGKRHRWDSTSGTGSASEQTGRSGSFSLTSTSTVTATYKVQWQDFCSDWSGCFSDWNGGYC